MGKVTDGGKDAMLQRPLRFYSIRENDSAQKRGARFIEVRRGGARQVWESPVQWRDWVTS